MSTPLARRPASHWLLLLSLVALWGSAFGLVKIAIESFTPAALVLFRVGVAALVLCPMVLWLGRRWPRSKRFWLFSAILAAAGNCLPFLFITIAQQHIDSGLTGILMAIMPLSTLALAHFFVAEERLTKGRLLGCLIGFFGIIVLIGPAALAHLGGSGSEVIYQLVALAAALSYAANAIIARHRPPADPLVASASVMVLATLFMIPMGGHDLFTQLASAAPAPLLAALILALPCTALATVLFLRLVTAAGPSFMSFINYLIPLWALLVGMAFLNEQPRWSALVALGLILIGIAISETWGRRAR